MQRKEGIALTVVGLMPLGFGADARFGFRECFLVLALLEKRLRQV